MKRFVFILFIFSLFSCKETKKENISHLVKEWNNKKIVYPDIMHFTVLGADTNFLFKSEYRIITYVDSAGCTSCKLKLEWWKKFISQLDTIGNLPVLFFLHPKNRKELNYILKRDNFNYPVCIDENDSLNKLNHFPSDLMFQTFLLDKDNRVLAIGNPIHNPKVKELYLKIIQGEKVEKDKGTEVINTKVTIDKTSISLGRFNWQKEQKVTFTLKNTGNKPLVVQDVDTSCGCTSVSYSKEPVQPGGELKLEVTYTAEHPEHFNKTIMVYCNMESSPLVLKIMGDAE